VGLDKSLRMESTLSIQILVLPRKIRMIGICTFLGRLSSPKHRNAENTKTVQYIRSRPKRDYIQVKSCKADVRHVDPIDGNRGQPKAPERMEH